VQTLGTAVARECPEERERERERERLRKWGEFCA